MSPREAEQLAISASSRMPAAPPREALLVGELLTWGCQFLQAKAMTVCRSDHDGIQLLAVAGDVGALTPVRHLPPDHPLSIGLSDVQRQADGIAIPIHRGMSDDLGHFVAVPLVLPRDSGGGALVAFTGERTDGESAAGTLTMLARLISRELAVNDRRRDMQNLRSMVQLASNSFLIVDATGVITFANGANRELIGYGPEDLTGSQVFA